ncbi:MAG: DEAD/DEAH box helicase, partial [Lentisphaeraceae bacterium]|nr:DEAD/DEAH box helicase [Lentisphaeraceae bacterium]
MSNKVLSLQDSDIIHLLGCLEQSLSQTDSLNFLEHLKSNYGFMTDSSSLERFFVKSSELPLTIHWTKLKQRNLIQLALELNDKVSSSTRVSREREIIFHILSNESVLTKKLIKSFCIDFKVKPNDLILKLFTRHLDPDLLKLLPEEYSLLLTRNIFYENCFSPDISDSLDWLSKHSVNTEEGKVAGYFQTGNIDRLDGKISVSFKSWSSRKYQTVCEQLSFLTDLISRNKVNKARLCPYIIPVHIYSMATESVPAAKKILLVYKELFGDSMLVKSLEIYLLLLSQNFKKAGKILDSLKFFHKDFYSDTFFILLCRYWCNGHLTINELEKLKQLLEDYSNSENSLMKFELQSLYKEAIGATDLIEDQLLYKHKPLAAFLKTDKSIFDILDEQTDTTEKRLIWLVSIEPSSVNTEGWVDIEPAIQEKGKSSTWKSPDLIPWKEFNKKEIKNLLSSNDRKIVNLLKDTTETLGLDYTLPENDALRILCHSDNAYLEDDHKQQVRFEEVNPVIEYFEENGQQVFKWKFPLSPGALHIEEVDDHVYEVCILNNRLLKLKENSTTSLRVSNSKEELQSFFSKLPNNLIVEGDDTLVDQTDTIKSTEIIARFIPSSGNNYRIRILAGCSGMAVIPGEGRRILSLKKDGKDLIWERDKKTELKRVNDIISDTELDFNECILPYEWELSEPQKILAILEILNNNPDVTLQWPRGGKLKVSSSKGGSISVKSSSKKNWFTIDGEIVFDKQAVKLSEILKSFNGNNRFIEIRDREFLALSKELMKGISEVLELTDQRDECLELHVALSDTLSSKLSGLPVDVEEEFIFRECVTNMIYSKSLNVEIPEGFNAQLRSYQLEGYKWLTRMINAEVGVCLADDMGLGKTIQTLCLLLHQKTKGPSLIVAPTSLCHNWLCEAEKFTQGLNLKMYTGQERQSLLTKLNTGDVLVVSYGLLLQDIDYIKEVNWNVTVLDEAQMVKNAGTLRSKAIKILQSRSRLALSGTPVENHVGELWNLFDWLNPGFLGSRSFFQDQYALPIEKNIPGVLKKLKEKVKPFILRRMKKDVLKDLPDNQETIIYVDLNEREREIYNASKYLVSKKLNKSKKEKRNGREKIQILAEITKLRKVTSNFELSEVFSGMSSKSEAVISKVEELLENDHKALLFSQFTSHLDLIEVLLKEKSYSYSRLDGTMNVAQ